MQITEEVRDQLLEASAATRKAFTTFRREADPDDHYQSGQECDRVAWRSCTWALEARALNGGSATSHETLGVFFPPISSLITCG